MSDYSITNLKDVDDSAAGRGGDLEARFGRKHLDSEHLGVSYFRYGPRFRAPYGHRHREQEEAYVVVGGSGSMRLDDEVIELHRVGRGPGGAERRAGVRGRPRWPRADRDRR